MPLYAFGSNGSGQLGVGHTEDLVVPTTCLFAEDDDGLGVEKPTDRDLGKVACIVAGGNHTLVHFTSGAVYTAGSNASGRCLHAGGTEALLRFSRVVINGDDGDGGGSDGRTEERKIDQFSVVSATWETSFLVDADRTRLYVVGGGPKGELGLDQAVTEARVPVMMPNFPPADTEIVAVSSGVWHTVVVLSNGEVYGWGSARKGQLGQNGVQSKFYWSPTKIEDVSFPVRQAACGREFTVFVGDSTAGDVMILGSDKWDIKTAAPKSLKGYASVSASWHGVYVHYRDGSLDTWGRNDRGQLPPSDTPNPDMVAIGSEHVIALIDSTKVIACGWGEHGNCGPTTDAQKNVAQHWANIPLDLKEGQYVTGVGAGCATSWVVTT